MKLLLTTTALIVIAAVPGVTQTSVPGTVRADTPLSSGAPAETARTDTGVADLSGSVKSVRTDNAPIRDSDLTTETAKDPVPPSLKPWAPTTTGNLAAKAPPQ